MTDRNDRRRVVCSLALSAALVAASAASACSQTPSAQYPKSLTAARSPATEEAPVHVLRSHTEFRFDDKGNWSEVFTEEYRVLNRRGVETWGDTGSGFSPWYMERPVIRASVKDPELGVRELDPKTLVESAAYPDVPAVYGDRRVLRGPLPGVRVGSIITETITTKTRRPFFTGGSAFVVPFQNNVPRDTVELVIDVPESLPFNHEILDAKVKKTETKQNGRRRIVFQGGPYPAIEGIDYYAPSNLPAWPAVAFSTGASWQQIASAYDDVVEDKLEGADLADFAKKVVAPEDAPLVKANKLLNALRERVRYAAVEFGLAAIIPAKPAETLLRAYGDCKDQALLLTGLLRAVGLPAKLALLRAGPGMDVRPGLPALDVFDHAIVVIPGAEPVWIDPTASLARAAELPEGDEGRLALVVDDDTKELMMTPVSTMRENTYFEERVVELQEEGPAFVREVSRGTGLLDQRLRETFSESKEALTKSLADYMKSIYLADNVSSSKYGNAYALAEPFEVTIETRAARIANTDLVDAFSMQSYKVLASYLPEVLFDEEPRTIDLVLPLNYRAEILYRIVPPKHFVVRRTPNVKDLELGPVKLARTYKKNADNSVEARFVLTAAKRQFTPADTDAFREAYEALGEESPEFVEFEHEGKQAIEARQTVKGIEIFRKLSEAEPKSALALIRLALYLNEVGFGRVAREKAKSAVALAPSSALVHGNLAAILEYDDFGRHLHLGWDREGARASYRRAAELDPKDTHSKVEGAILLEYDATGRRYGVPADLERAVAEYDAIPKAELAEYDDGTYKDIALFALFYAGKLDELRRRLGELKPEEVPHGLSIAMAVATAGVVAANPEADRLDLRGEARSEAFSGAAASLSMTGRYREASGLFDLAAGDSKQAADYSRKARVFQNTTRVDPQRLSTSTPEALVRKAHLLVALAEDRASVHIEDLLSSRGPRDLLRTTWLPLSKMGKDMAPSRAVFADVMNGMTKMVVEGNDDTGYRVRMNIAVPGIKGSNVDHFVVREGSKYGIRALADAPELGCEALYLVGKKNEKAARQWLAWAKEMVSYGTGDDPLLTPPFLGIWNDGKGRPELAAAALCARGADHKKALEKLEAARATPGVDAALVDRAILEAASTSDEHQRVLDAVKRLSSANPSSKLLRWYELGALWQLERFDDYEKLVRKALEKLKSPGDERADMLQSLGSVHARRGRVTESRRAYQTIIDERQASSGVYNSAAWDGLFVEPRPKDLLSLALQAAQLSSFKSYAELHTLAVVYVEQGMIEEARQTLTQLLELSATDRPNETTFYVIGAIAEAYGLTDTARSAYQELKPPKDGWPQSTYVLAKKRLEALDKKARPRSGAGAR